MTHARTITPNAHYSAAQACHADGRGCYSKASESQADAIKRWRAADRRRLTGGEKRNFPLYKPGMSTADYVRTYEGLNQGFLRSQNDGFWQKLNTKSAALYEGGLLDFAVIAEDAEDIGQAQPVQVQAQHQAPDPIELVQSPEPAPEVHQAESVEVQAEAPSTGYALPRNTAEDWEGSKKRGWQPTMRQAMVIDAVSAALDSGLFYKTEVDAFCLQRLRPSMEDAARHTKSVVGGDFGMDCYYARRAIEARCTIAAEDAAHAALQPVPGLRLGVLMFSDLKVTNCAEVIGLSGDGLEVVISAKRGGRPVQWTGPALHLRYAMERAHERGKRRDTFDAFCASRPHPAPEPAPEVHQAEPVEVQAQAQHQAPEPAELVHQAHEPGSVNPAGSPVPDVLTGAHVRRLMRAHGATIERVSGALGVTRARVRQVRERGLSGLPYVLDWLQGITGRAPALAGGVWWHHQGRPPGLPGPEPAELVTAAPGGPPGVSDPPMASPATDYPIIPHGFSVALTQRLRPIQARPMRTRRADIRTRHAEIRTRRAPMRTRGQPLQPVQARARLPCPGPAGPPGGRAGGPAPRGQAPPPGVAASAAPSPGCRGQCGRLQAGRTLAGHFFGCATLPRHFPDLFPTSPELQEFTP